MAHKNRSNQSPHPGQKGRTYNSQRHRKPQETFSFSEADDRIFDVFRNHGFGDYPHAKRQKLTNFYLLLMQEQKKQNFTRLTNLRDVAIKHFIDCLMVPRLIRLEFPLIDLGTGPGFPGIPLKIEHPDDRIILAEGVQKRVEFLKLARSKLDLKNLDILGRHVMDDFFYPVQGFITRAVEDVSNTLNKTHASLPIGGKVYLMKGPSVDPEIEAAKTNERFRLSSDLAYEIPQTPHARRLLVYEKVQ